MKLVFEHNYQQKYMELSFEGSVQLKSTDDVMNLRQQWLGGLSSWHSPYKAIIDGSQLSLSADAEDDLKGALGRMETLLKGFFLKKAVIYGLSDELKELFPFECTEGREEAFDKAGLRAGKKRSSTDFRSMITLQNHFQQHVMELSFESDVKLDSKEKLMTLRSKITNNLMQWHSAWNLLIDCTHLEFSEEFEPEFQSMTKFFKGFFLKEVLGYSPKSKDLSYPFKVYRSRHNAAGRLEFEGNFSGEEANCQSRK